jgi:hypothetical protein
MQIPFIRYVFCSEQTVSVGIKACCSETGNGKFNCWLVTGKIDDGGLSISLSGTISGDYLIIWELFC